MKQKLKWKKPTRENLEEVDSYDELLLKCRTTIAHHDREFVVSGRKNGSYFKAWDICSQEKINLLSNIKVISFAVFIKDELGPA